MQKSKINVIISCVSLFSERQADNVAEKISEKIQKKKPKKLINMIFSQKTTIILLLALQLIFIFIIFQSFAVHYADRKSVVIGRAHVSRPSSP